MRVLCVGHLTVDRYPGGPRLGGGVLYAALAFRAAGATDVRAVAVAGDEVLQSAELARLRELLPMAVHRDAATTTFRNTYDERGARVQWIEAVARPVVPADVPAQWAPFDLVFLAPVIGEIDLADWLAATRPSTRVSLGAQGWLKHAPPGHGSRQGQHVRWPVALDALAERVQVASMSTEDLVADPDAAARLAEVVDVVAVTRGADGASLWRHGARQDIPAATADRIVDPTGAGDVFAATLAWGVATGLTTREAGQRAARAAAHVLAAQAYDAFGFRPAQSQPDP